MKLIIILAFNLYISFSFGGELMKSCRYSEEQRQIFTIVNYATQELYQNSGSKNVPPYLYWWEQPSDEDTEDQIHRHEIKKIGNMFGEANQVLINSKSKIIAYAVAWEDIKVKGDSRLPIVKIAAGFSNQNGYEVYYELDNFIDSPQTEIGCSVNLLNNM